MRKFGVLVLATAFLSGTMAVPVFAQDTGGTAKQEKKTEKKKRKRKKKKTEDKKAA